MKKVSLKTRTLKMAAMLALAGGLAASYNGCGSANHLGTPGAGSVPSGQVLSPSTQGTSGGNPFVSFNFRSYTSPSIGNLSLCIKRVQLKHTDEDPTGIPGQDFAITMPQFSALPAGENLGTLNVAPGSYHEVDIDLDNKCNVGKSVGVVESTTEVDSQGEIHLQFFDTIGGEDSRGEINLDLQSFINALNGVTSGTKIKQLMESTQGAF